MRDRAVRLAHQAHDLKVEGSNPFSAKILKTNKIFGCLLLINFAKKFEKKRTF